MLNGKLRVLVVGLILVVLIFVFHLWRMVNLFLDFQVLTRIAMTDTGPGLPAETKPGDPPPKYTPNFIASLTVSESLSDQMSSLVHTPWDTYGSTQTSEAQFREAFEKIPDLPNFEAKIEQRVARELASLATYATPPERVRFSGPTANYRLIRGTARVWYVIAKGQVLRNEGKKALATLVGIALIAHTLETTESRLNGLTLLSRMIGIAVRNIAAGGLCTMADSFHLTQDETATLFDAIEKLERNMASMSLPMECERKAMPSMVYEAGKAIEDGSAKRLYGRNPSYLIRALADQQTQDELLNPVYEPALQAPTLPWPQARELLKKQSAAIEALCRKTTTYGPHFWGYFFRPERYFVELLLSISVPNFRKAYEAEVACRQKLYGSMVVVGMNAYRDAIGAWPTSLNELARWLGRPVPPDLFGPGPMQYKPGQVPHLYSVGPDSTPDTPDDLRFWPLE